MPLIKSTYVLHTLPEDALLKITENDSRMKASLARTNHALRDVFFKPKEWLARHFPEKSAAVEAEVNALNPAKHNSTYLKIFSEQEKIEYRLQDNYAIGLRRIANKRRNLFRLAKEADKNFITKLYEPYALWISQGEDWAMRHSVFFMDLKTRDSQQRTLTYFLNKNEGQFILDKIYQDHLLVWFDTDDKISPQLLVHNMDVLEWAILCFQSPNVMDALINAGCDVHKAQHDGLFPLMKCVIYGNKMMAKYLLETHKVDSLATTADAKSALSIAKQKGDTDFINLFSEHQLDVDMQDAENNLRP